MIKYEPLPPRSNLKSLRKYIVSEFVYSLRLPLPQLPIITAVHQVSYGSNVGGKKNSSDFFIYEQYAPLNCSEKLYGLNFRIPEGMYSHFSTGTINFVQFSSSDTGRTVMYHFYLVPKLVKL
jgi:hypothetical protein